MATASANEKKTWTHRLSVLLASIGYLSLFNENLDLGFLVGGIVEFYESARDLVFSPLDVLGLPMPERTKNFFLIVTLVATSFLTRGGSRNQAAAICFLSSFVWLIVIFSYAVSIFYVGLPVIKEHDMVGFENLSTLSKLLYSVIIVTWMPAGYLCGFPVFWIYFILFPFAGYVFKKFEFLEFFWRWAFSLSDLNFKILHRFGLIEQSEQYNSVISEFSDWWGVEGYVEYYRPLIESVILSGILLFIGKVIFQSLGG